MASDSHDKKHVYDRCYLDFPRIHFYGQFRANVGTANNDINNYPPATIQKATTKDNNVQGDWNYDGDMTWSFSNCKVTAAYDLDGKQDTETYKSFQVNPSNKQVSGRLTDLGML